MPLAMLKLQRAVLLSGRSAGVGFLKPGDEVRCRIPVDERCKTDLDSEPFARRCFGQSRQSVVRALNVRIRTKYFKKIDCRIGVERDDVIDEGQRSEHCYAIMEGVDGSRWPFQAPYTRVGIEANNEDVTEGFRLH